MASRQLPASATPPSANKPGRALHVCIVGAGLAGLACAVAAASTGARVDVVDEHAAPAAQPAHVNVVPNLLRDLVALGVADACVKTGFPYRGIRVMDGSGRHCVELPTERLAPLGYPEALGIAHGDLAAILARAAQAQGAHLQWRTRIDALGWQHDKATLALSDGRTMAPDLTLLATGATSALRREAMQHCTAPTALGPQWTHALLPRLAGQDHATLVLDNAGQRAFVVPVGPTTVGIALTRGEAGGPLPAVLQPLMSHMRPDTPRIERPLLAALLPAPWHRGNLVCIGECAHALPPHLGQSAAQALEDAIVLRELLAQGLSPGVLARRFTERREPRVAQVFDLVSQAARAQLMPDASTDLQDLFRRLSRLVAEPA